MPTEPQRLGNDFEPPPVAAPNEGESRGRHRGVSIVVPTFREAPNIRPLVARVEAAMSVAGLQWELILVDDNSDDGVEVIVADLAATRPIRIAIRRDAPRDLSKSVLLGFRLARLDRLVVLDADLSHPPERIVDLLSALDEDCDIVIGSRYVEGGVVERAWSLWSYLNSRLATVLALPLVRCSDPMSGFFAIRRAVVPAEDRMQAAGYKIGLELMVRGRLRIREVPIRFAERAVGSSKMTWRHQVEFLRQLRRLYMDRHGSVWRVLSFGLVGASGMFVDVTGYVALQWIGLEHRLARLLSFWPAVTWNWFFNRHVTFGDRPPRPRARQWARFVCASLVGLGANVGAYTLLTTLVEFFDRYRFVGLACGIGLGSLFNFLAATSVVYREHSEPNAGLRLGIRK